MSPKAQIMPKGAVGLAWEPIADTLSLVPKADKTFLNTRCGMMSALHTLFDPIGFTAPFMLRGKLLYQECLTQFPSLTWDETLPPAIAGK